MYGRPFAPIKKKLSHNFKKILSHKFEIFKNEMFIYIIRIPRYNFYIVPQKTASKFEPNNLSHILL